MLFILVNFALANQLEKVGQLVNKQQCLRQSPKFEIKYELQTVQNIRGVFFCDEYSKRTCCSEKNFNDLKMKLFRDYSMAQSVSQQCQQVYQHIVCAECDGDIGQGVRRGLCPRVCQRLYDSCKDDLFQYDDNAHKLRFCQKNDAICSYLKVIESNPERFCQDLGFPQNENDQLENWIDNRFHNVQQDPLCFDGIPSSKYWPKIEPIGDDKQQKESNSSSSKNNRTQQTVYEKYFEKLPYLFLALVVIFMMYQAIYIINKKFGGIMNR
ncbi:hypothetical protein pb186bvf_011619 [Paramecium bursaria]